MNEDLKHARELMQSFLKSKKILRMYPRNNPIYINTLEDNFGKFKEFFYLRDELKLQIRQNEVQWEGEQIYQNPEKDDNLALFFFKDGIREITFSKGLNVEELEDFLSIISMDFSREALDDDLVTLFWEKDFQNIHYVVDDTVLADDEDYESRATKEIKEKEADEDSLLKAYEEAFHEEDMVKDTAIVPLTDKDLQALLQELEKDSFDKSVKLTDILFEMLYSAVKKEDLDELAEFFMSALEYAISRGDFGLISKTLARITKLAEDKVLSDDVRKMAGKIITFAGGEKIITLVGEVLDSGQEIDEKILDEYVRVLDRNAIVPFMKILGELKSIHARKVVIDALIFLGGKDITTLAKGLSDSRWYVVRNIIYILRKIGDKRAVDYLLKTVRHGDIRVRKEVIRTLGELGGGGVIQALRECLEDPDIQVRSAGLKALGNVGSEASRRIILNKITDKNFRDKDFEEKKEYFEVLSRWKDAETFNLLLGILKKASFFTRSKNFENRACAAYCLGLMGNKDALVHLNKYKNDGNKLLKEYAFTAIKRIESGQ